MGEVNGNITTGIVFLCDNEEWKAVCDENWDVNDASVVCQELGLSNDGMSSYLSTDTKQLLDDIPQGCNHLGECLCSKIN